MDTMNHKGYNAIINYDIDDKLFTGKITEINDTIGFHGSSIDELKAAFIEAVEDYITTCKKVGKETLLDIEF